MKKAVVSEPIDRRNRLAELGLDAEELWKCIERGQAARAECTDNHPRLYWGVRAWAETISALREYLLPQPNSWTRSDDGNLPMTVNKAGTLALIVWTGDEDTGRVDGNPSTKSSKGPRAKDVIEDNLKYTLFGDIRKVRDNVGGKMVYVLLFYHDFETREIRGELSKPIKIKDDGYVDGWAERIILGSRPFGGDRIKETPDVQQTQNLEVEIKRRSA